MLTQVREGTFHPDASRSGLFAEAAPPSQGSTSSSSRSSASSQCSEDGQDDQAVLAEDVERRIIRNLKRPFFVHIQRDEDTLCCGKALPKGLEVLKDLPHDAKLCPMCF